MVIEECRVNHSSALRITKQGWNLKDSSFWRAVLFSGLSKFNLDGTDSRVRESIQQNTEVAGAVFPPGVLVNLCSIMKMCAEGVWMQTCRSEEIRIIIQSRPACFWKTTSQSPWHKPYTALNGCNAEERLLNIYLCIYFAEYMMQFQTFLGKEERLQHCPT